MAKKEEAVQNLQDIGGASASSEVKKREAKVDQLGRSYGTGRRKESVARVWVKRGKGKIIVNGPGQKASINWRAIGVTSTYFSAISGPSTCAMSGLKDGRPLSS